MTEPALVHPESLESVQPTGALRTARYLDRGVSVIQDTHTALYWLRQPLRPATPASEQPRFWRVAWRWLRRLIGCEVTNPVTTSQTGGYSKTN